MKKGSPLFYVRFLGVQKLLQSASRMLLTAPELHLFQKGRCILLSLRMHHSLLWKMPWKLSHPKSFPPKFSWTDELLKSRRWDGAPAPVRRSLQRAHLRGCLITPTPVPTAQGPIPYVNLSFPQSPCSPPCFSTGSALHHPQGILAHLSPAYRAPRRQWEAQPKHSWPSNFRTALPRLL